jgi:L-ascorbate metabolism protein UlaG (beta-lactamase superfamily)
LRIVRLSKASWIKIVTEGSVLHFDPGYTGYFRSQGVPPAELRDKADLILISHFHKDHLQPEAVDMIRTERTTVVAPPSCATRLSGPCVPAAPGDSITAGVNVIKVVHAYNLPEAHSTRKVHHRGRFVGYTVTIDNKVIYHAGDTDFIPEMNDLGPVDVAFLPMGGTFVMDAEEALAAAAAINPRIVIPVHQSNADHHKFADFLSTTCPSIEAVALDVGEALEIS